MTMATIVCGTCKGKIQEGTNGAVLTAICKPCRDKAARDLGFQIADLDNCEHGHIRASCILCRTRRANAARA